MSASVPPAASTAVLRFSQNLAGLRLDVADAGDAAVGATRHHAGDEHQAAARLDDDALGEMAARLGEGGRDDRLTWHCGPRAASALAAQGNPGPTARLTGTS